MANTVPNHQRTCRKCLTDWLKTYRQIKFHGSRVEAVSQLVSFGKEMEAVLAVPLAPALPLEIATALRHYNQPIGHRIVDAEVAAMVGRQELTPEQMAASPVTPRVVGDVDEPEKDIELPVDFHGVIEGRKMETMTIPPMAECGNLDYVPPPVVLVPDFPQETELTLIAACPNPRLLQGQLADGRKVTVWKGPRHWRIPSKVFCRRDLNTPASAPTYLPV